MDPDVGNDDPLGSKIKEILAIIQSQPDSEKIAMMKVLSDFTKELPSFLNVPQDEASLAANTIEYTNAGASAAATAATPTLTNASSPTSSTSTSPLPGQPELQVVNKRKEAADQQTIATKPKRRRRSGPIRAKPLQLTRKLKSPDDLTEISMAMTEQYTVTKLQQIRQTFCNELLQLSRPEGDRHTVRPGQEADKLFDPQSAAQLSQFFFENTMGESGMNQISQFVCDYTPTTENAVDAGAANRLRAVATDSNAPMALRKFCGSLSAEISRDQEEQSIMGHLNALNRSLMTFETYQEVCRKIDADQSQIWAYINSIVDAERVAAIKRAARTTTSSGVSHASVALDVLVAISEVPRTTVTSKIDRIRPLELLIRKLGKGFLMLLPISTTTFLRDIGVGRLGPACDILLKHCPFLPEFVRLLEQYVWQPYQDGAKQLPLDVTFLEPQPGEGRFLDQLHSAANNFRTIRTLTDGNDAIDANRIQELDD